MSAYTGKWLFGELTNEDGMVIGMVVCPKDEVDHHDVGNRDCACKPECSPIVAEGAPLGLMISHNSFLDVPGARDSLE